MIWATPPSYSPGDQGTAVLNLGAKKGFLCLGRPISFSFPAGYGQTIFLIMG